MKKALLILIILGIVVSSLFIFPVLTAQADCAPGPILPPCTCSGNCQLNDFLALGTNLAQYGIGILSVITLAFIIYGGFSMLTAMGNREKIESGKRILGGTFRGMAIVLLAWIIVNTIIFFFTGNTSGLLFGSGDPWWKFRETPLSNSCPARVVGNCTDLQACIDTSTWTEQQKRNNFCVSRGVCSGNENVICCDTGQHSCSNPN